VSDFVTNLREHLILSDVRWILRRLPKQVLAALKERPESLVLAGGFIRSVIANEQVNDVDLFTTNKDAAEAVARKMAYGGEVHESDNAFTVRGRGLPVQVIHRWTFERPELVVPSFDFTIARAAMWFGRDSKWHTQCDERFYPDLAAKRLVYCCPDRNEDAGGSLLRMLKFYQRGYRSPLDSIGGVVSRLMRGVKGLGRFDGDENGLAKVLTGLLREVDPNADPGHDAHLPAESAEEIEELRDEMANRDVVPTEKGAPRDEQ